MTEEGNVDVCPVTKEAWEARAEAKKADCGGQSVYHCLPDSEGRKWEKCVQRTLVVEGYCPIFTSDGFIDWKRCNNSKPTCPNISYVSDEVYKHSGCFGNNTAKRQTIHSIELSLLFGLIIGGTVLCILGITIAVIIKHRRTRKDPFSKEEEDTELKTLLPDGISEVVVKEQNVLNGLTTLLREGVQSIVVLGSFGNSVSSTSRRIINELKEKSDFKSCQCRFTDIPDNVKENTVLFVYGWFGFWNDDLCSVDTVREACEKLDLILSKTQRVKLIIGMRSDLHRKYHVVLEEHAELFHHEINLDSANVYTDAEYLRYFKEKIKDPCKKEDCSCKKLTFEMLRQKKDKVVGMPLKITILAKYHELVSRYIQSSDILKVMTDYFTALEKNDEMRNVYGWIKYICLKGKFSPSEKFDENLVENLRKSSFDENKMVLKEYVRMRNSDQQNKVSSEDAQYVFWHPFIYICVFHSLFNQDPQFLMNHCNVDAILQLVRPKGTKTSYIEVASDEQSVNLFIDRLHRLGLPEKYKNHPMVKVSASI